MHGDVRITSFPGRSAPVPRQLPLSATGFVDRTAHLRHLDALAEEAEVRVPVAVLSGPPGVGKTALAVHWAHHARARFPDGCLYVGVRAHAPGPRTEAAQALDSLLRALGVPPDRIPLDLDSRSALYRTEIDGKRLLIVIDDILEPAQVRPLLPASPGCMVVVNSRNTLPGLIAREGAGRLPWTSWRRPTRWLCSKTRSVRVWTLRPARRRNWPNTARACPWACEWRPSGSSAARMPH